MRSQAETSIEPVTARLWCGFFERFCSQSLQASWLASVLFVVRASDPGTHRLDHAPSPSCPWAACAFPCDPQPALVLDDRHRVVCHCPPERKGQVGLGVAAVERASNHKLSLMLVDSMDNDISPMHDQAGPVETLQIAGIDPRLAWITRSIQLTS